MIHNINNKLYVCINGYNLIWTHGYNKPNFIRVKIGDIILVLKIDKTVKILHKNKIYQTSFDKFKFFFKEI